jgi:hypothetical protein
MFWSEDLGRRPLGRLSSRWDDNIKLDLRKIRLDGVDWINLAQDRDQLRDLVNTVKHLHVSVKGEEFLE